MIINMNVCDNCGNQSEIPPPRDKTSPDEEPEKGFAFHFYTTSLQRMVADNRFSSTKYKSGTFCDKECLLQFIKDNLDAYGRMK